MIAWISDSLSEYGTWRDVWNSGYDGDLQKYIDRAYTWSNIKHNNAHISNQQ